MVYILFLSALLSLFMPPFLGKVLQSFCFAILYFSLDRSKYYFSLQFLGIYPIFREGCHFYSCVASLSFFPRFLLPTETLPTWAWPPQSRAKGSIDPRLAPTCHMYPHWNSGLPCIPAEQGMAQRLTAFQALACEYLTKILKVLKLRLPCLHTKSRATQHRDHVLHFFTLICIPNT